MTTTSTTKPIYYIDASSMKDFACFRKIFWNIIEGYSFKPSADGEKTFKMDYGNAGHLYMNDIYSGLSPREGIERAMAFYAKKLEGQNLFDEEGKEDYRTIDHLIEVLKLYTKNFRGKDAVDSIEALVDEESKKPMVEQKFAWPFYECERFAIMLSGIIDINGKYLGQRGIIDHKFTSLQPKRFFKQFEFDIQPMFYSWMDNKVNKRGDIYLPCIINGIFIKAKTKKAEAAGYFDGVRFERSDFIHYTAEQMAEFERWFTGRIHNLIVFLENDYDIESTMHEPSFCRTPYGLCKYFNVCKMPSAARRGLLDGYFIKQPYNPLTRYED